MRIHEILIESQNLEEGPIWDKTKAAGRKVQKGLRAAGDVVGQVAAVPQGVGRAIKKGYQKGVQAIGGTNPGERPVAQDPEQSFDPAGDTQEVPGANVAQSANPNVRQINKLVPSLKTRDLQSIKKKVDNTLAVRAQKANKGNLSKSFDQTVDKVTKH